MRKKIYVELPKYVIAQWHAQTCSCPFFLSFLSLRNFLCTLGYIYHLYTHAHTPHDICAYICICATVTFHLDFLFGWNLAGKKKFLMWQWHPVDKVTHPLWLGHVSECWDSPCGGGKRKWRWREYRGGARDECSETCLICNYRHCGVLTFALFVSVYCITSG